MRTSVVAIACAVASTAIAQSKRYPPEPVDKDLERDRKSKLWDQATNPSTRPYEELVARARRLLGGRTPDQLLDGVARLGEAIALQPAEPEAYQLRGAAHMELRMWRECTQDLEAAVVRQPPDTVPARELADQRLRLGVCLARSGRLVDGERLLADGVATGTGTGEMMMRLGEVRIALGRLEEAIASLTAALEMSDLPSQSLTRWLLASAYDRSRRPADAINAARLAASYDRSYSALTNQSIPLLGDGETEYLLGLAHSTSEPAVAEKALVYFRRFVRIAPESPWRRRVDDHLRELESAKLPETVERRGGLAALDLDQARASVRKHMPAMRACMAKLPSSVLEVTLTRNGPRTPAPLPKKGRQHYAPAAPPPEGAGVTLALNVESVPRADTDGAARCIEPIAARLALPAVAEKDGWYKIAFLVVSP